MAYDLSVLDQGCQEMGIVLDGEQRQQFVDFYEYLVEKNKVMNLTGITEFQEVLVKHFLDSLACVKAVDIKKVKRMMDVGTGAGFPGVPLKIASLKADRYYGCSRKSRRICKKQSLQRKL